MARAHNFTTIALWSEGNDTYKHQYTKEKADVTAIIKNLHYVP